MATIKELNWKPHGAGVGGEQAQITFANGYGASVLRGGMFYTRGGTYEIGVLLDGKLDYESPPAQGDVRGYLSEAEANQVLAEIEALPPKTDAKAA